MNAPALEPWQWPEPHWRALVNRVRAGRSLKPASWPQGARFAVALSFDSDHETNELRDGGESIGKLSHGQYECCRLKFSEVRVVVAPTTRIALRHFHSSSPP